MVLTEHIAGSYSVLFARWPVHRPPPSLSSDSSHFSLLSSSFFASFIPSPSETSSIHLLDLVFTYLRTLLSLHSPSSLCPIATFRNRHFCVHRHVPVVHSSTRLHAMTAASPLAFPAMEVPAAEDSMEMASPYQGQADDFDIDIDIMEDHVSNMDSDMMGADDYPTSQPALFENDVNNDADMVDEPSEGSMVDVVDYVEEDHDIEVQDEEVTFEAEMREGDQDINVDTPAIQIEAPVKEDTMDRPVQNLTDIAERPEGQEGPGDVTEAAPAEPQPQASDDQAQGVPLEPSTSESGQPEQPEGIENAKASAHTDKKEIVEINETNETTEGKDLSAEDSHAPGETTVENPSPSQVESAPHEAKHEHTEEDSHGLHETDVQNHQEDESLHPVKVIYQDNDISLFPPLEGDSAETFFLHDEDVAYESIGKLFGSLREVLLDNVAENEVLVIDIDSLGIQITEVCATPCLVCLPVIVLIFSQDSSYTSQITLHQILDIYLRLCHNDGADEPEALYLTLSSKVAANSELASLDAAAKEGKGLSQIHTWNDYDKERPVEEEAANVQEDTYGDETHQDQSLREPDEGTQEQEVPGDESHDGNGDETAREETVPEPSTGNQETENEAGPEHVSAVEEVEEAQEYQQPDEAVSSHGDDYNEDRYESEAHKTESSITLAETSAANEHTEEYADDFEGAEDQPGTNDQDVENGGHEKFAQEQVEANDHVGTDEFQEDFVHEEGLPEANADNDQTVHEEEGPHEAEAAAEDEIASAENLAGDLDQADYEQSESTLENAPQEGAVDREGAPELEHDSLEFPEDSTQSPSKDLGNGQHEKTEGGDHEQYDEYEGANEDEDELAAPPADQDGADDQESADDFDEYYPPPDLEVTEAIELGGTDGFYTDSQTLDNLSTKRSREEGEEWDIADTPTPDIKRRRS